MSERLFQRILIMITVLGLSFTVGLVGYTMEKQKNGSIITYIGNER